MVAYLCTNVFILLQVCIELARAIPGIARGDLFLLAILTGPQRSAPRKRRDGAHRGFLN